MLETVLSTALRSVPMDERTGRALGAPEHITRGGLTEPGLFSLSADGTRIVDQEHLPAIAAPPLAA